MSSIASRQARAFALVGLCLSLVSCYENESAGSSTVTALFDVLERVTIAECDCDAADPELQPGEEDGCTSRLERYACIEPIIQRRADQLQEWAECSLEVFRELEACYERFGCDELAVETCFEGLEVEDACGEPPDPANDLVEEEIEHTCLQEIDCADGTTAEGNVCNETPECRDGSDETGCASDVDFACDNGEEISISWVCDGVPDCEDASDESEAQCASSGRR